jgi:hypothetical protein
MLLLYVLGGDVHVQRCVPSVLTYSTISYLLLQTDIVKTTPGMVEILMQSNIYLLQAHGGGCCATRPCSFEDSVQF